MVNLEYAENTARNFVRKKWGLEDTAEVAILSVEPHGNDWAIEGRTNIPREKTIAGMKERTNLNKFTVIIDAEGNIKSYKFEPIPI